MYTRSMATGWRLGTAQEPPPAAASSFSNVIDELQKLRPIDFTLQKLVDLQPNKASSVVGKFLMVQKIRESLATSFEDVATQVSELSQQLELEDSDEEPKLPIRDPCMSKHMGVIIDDPDCLSGNVLFHVNRIFQDLRRAVESHECPSGGLVVAASHAGGPTCGEWTDLLDLLAPVENKTVKWSTLVPAMEWLLQHPDGIIMKDFSCQADPVRSSKRALWIKRWQKWLRIVDECWAIRKYLDPFYVFLEEADGALFSEIVKSTNENFAHADPRLPEPAHIDVNPRYGSSPLRLRRFASLPEATQVASALRSHLSVPGAYDGSCGLAARICTFSCYNMIWW